MLHASPELGKVEVHINGQEELDEFTYGMVSDWIEVEPGTARVTIHRDRAGINYVVYDAYVPIVPDEDYDLIIADPLLSGPTLLPVPGRSLAAARRLGAPERYPRLGCSTGP